MFYETALNCESQANSGAPAVSSDYHGPFADALGNGIGGGVTIMSQERSGGQMWMDYGRPKSDITIQTYADEVAAVAWRVYRTIQYHASPALAMAETKISLKRRTPDAGRSTSAVGSRTAGADEWGKAAQPAGSLRSGAALPSYRNPCES
jgi:hypothetical protein